MSETPTVGIDHGDLVCPLCWSLCVVRIVKRFRYTEWVWWCSCGWTSETHREPRGPVAGLTNRLASWKRLNRWSDLRMPDVV
jgi:hypothetical protein